MKPRIGGNRASACLPLLIALLVAGMLSAVGTVALAQPPAPATQPALSPANQDLLHRLETGTWRQRKEAGAALSAKGVDQIPVLRAMLAQTSNPEAQARITAALEELADKVLIGPTLVTLHFKNAPAKSVFAELFKQAGAPLETEPVNLLDTLKPVSIDADHQPFWAVMLQLQKKTGVELRRWGDLRLVLRPNAGKADGAQVMADQFLFVLRPSGQKFPVSPRLPGGNRTSMIRMAIGQEPKTRVALNSAKLTLVSATDDQGNALKPAALDDAGVALAQGVPIDWAPASIVLQVPANNPQAHVKDMKLQLTLQMALHHEHLEVADVTHAAAKTFTVGGVPITCTGCVRDHGVYQVNLTIGPDPEQLLMRAVVTPQDGMRLIDTQGRPMARVGSSSIPAANGTRVTEMFTATGTPARMEWDIPTDLHTVTIPIHFENIDIPLER